MTEHEEARLLADRVLDRVNADPDDDLAMLSRQFKRECEKTFALQAKLAIATEALRGIEDIAFDTEPLKACQHIARAALAKLEAK